MLYKSVYLGTRTFHALDQPKQYSQPNRKPEVVLIYISSIKTHLSQGILPRMFEPLYQGGSKPIVPLPRLLSIMILQVSRALLRT